MRVSALICGAVLALSGGSAFAQNNLGDLLDAGAKKLTKAEFEATVSAAEVSGPTRVGGTMQSQFKPDGSFTGTVTGPLGKPGGTFGSWKIDDTGKLCSEFTTSLGAAGSQRITGCGYYFKLGDQYFYSDSDTDRGAQVLKRTVKK